MHLGDGLHIFIYLQQIEGGGVERVAVRLARGWCALGHRVTLAVGADPYGRLDDAPDGLRVVPLGDGSYLGMHRVVDCIREAKPDLVWCAGNHYTAIAAWIRLRLGADCPPVVWKVSNSLSRPDFGPIMAFANRRWLRLHRRMFDQVVTMNAPTCEEAARVIGIPAGEIAVIPNPPLLPRGPAPTVALTGRVILGIGRLEPQKDWDLTLRAFALLKDQESQLAILGEGSRRAQLVALAKSLGIRDRVAFPGFVDDVRPWLAKADLLIATSKFEAGGGPNSVREAIAAGVPVAATDCSTGLVAMIPSNGGEVVAGRDPETIARAIERWAGKRTAPPPPVDPLEAARAYLDVFGALLQRVGRTG